METENVTNISKMLQIFIWRPDNNNNNDDRLTAFDPGQPG